MTTNEDTRVRPVAVSDVWRGGILYSTITAVGWRSSKHVKQKSWVWFLLVKYFICPLELIVEKQTFSSLQAFGEKKMQNDALLSKTDKHDTFYYYVGCCAHGDGNLQCWNHIVPFLAAPTNLCAHGSRYRDLRLQDSADWPLKNGTYMTPYK